MSRTLVLSVFTIYHYITFICKVGRFFPFHHAISPEFLVCGLKQQRCMFQGVVACLDSMEKIYRSKYSRHIDEYNYTIWLGLGP